jgi:VCBS repeat-containing protein
VPVPTDVDGTIDPNGYALGGTTVAQGSLTFNTDGSYSFDPGTDFDDLAAGATRDVTFTYTASDNNGATSAEQTVTISVTGTNDAAVIGGVNSGTVTEDTGIAGGLISATGGLTVSDADAGESGFQAETVSGSYGALVIDAAGNWVYSIDNSAAAIQQLDSGEAVLDTLTVRSLDGTTHGITITINGAKDAPVVGAAIPDQAAFLDTAFNFSLAAGSFIDADISDTLTYTATLADNSPLPAWLNFDAATRSFSGVPTGINPGAIDIRITADDGSASASQVFTLNVNGPTPTPVTDGTDPEPTPRTPDPVVTPAIVEQPPAPPGGEYVDAFEEYTPTPYVRVPQTSGAEPSNNVVEPELNDNSFAEILQGPDTATLSAQGTAAAEAPGQAVAAARESAEPVTSKPEHVDIEDSSSGNNDHETNDTHSRELLLSMMNDMRTSMEGDDSFRDAHKFDTGAFLGVTTTLTAGVVTWVLRSGALLASLMGAIPILGRFDLLPIIKVRDNTKEVESDDDTDLTGPDKENRKRVENMFSDHQGGRLRSEMKHE